MPSRVAPLLLRGLLLLTAAAFAVLPAAGPRPAHAAGYLVTTLADSGPGSLRQAILDANAAPSADTITFALSGTITLASSLPDITDPAGLTIDGSGQSVVVSGGFGRRPFTVAANAVAEMRSLTISGGLMPFGEGGGLRNLGNLTLSATLVSSNGAMRGGGIHNSSGGKLTILSSVVSENSAGESGAGIYTDGGTVHIEGSVLDKNSATAGAGAILNNRETVVLRSTISGNTATVGGGVYNGRVLTAVNTTFAGNRATTFGGGAIYGAGNDPLTLVASTISGNIAVEGGSVYGVFARAFSVTGSILSGNTATSGPDCGGAITAQGPNLIGDLNGCTIIGTPPIVADPLLGPLADNGGPTLTHALLPGSPAIDAGDDAVCIAAPVSGVDQRGVKRPQGAHCDLGAYERRPSEPLPLLNGDFEAGATGWTLAGLIDGIARVETQGSCFGANNTLGITFNGDRALNVRSSAGAPAGSTGIATSSAFTIGGALSFRALVENDDAVPAPDPVAFEVRILDEVGGVRATHAVKPAILTTSPGTSNDGCLVGDLRDGPWSAHTIDTSAYAGQTGRVEFRQHTNVAGKGFFALVDDVVMVP